VRAAGEWDDILHATAAVYLKVGSSNKTAKEMGLSRNAVQNRIKECARRGLLGSPEMAPPGFVVAKNTTAYDENGKPLRQWVGTKPEPGEEFKPLPGHVVRGESALVDADGRVLQRWVKTKEGAAPALEDALLKAFAAYDGACKPLPAPTAADDDLMTVYPLADLHVGMHSWGKETGDDYDVEIATDLVQRNIQALVAKSEPSKHAVILGLGDLYHQNDQKNATPGSGHRLDVDGRWSRVFEAGAKLIIALVDLVAQKHESVELVLLPGNHDEDASVCLRVALSLFYSNNPRVKVYHKPGLHWARRFGKVLIGATHGHAVRGADRMAMMLANDYSRDWGEADHVHILFGHIHHETAKEIGKVRVESFNTPAAKDAYAAGGGYRSGRSMSALTFHRIDGECSRHRVNIPHNWATVRAA
jgi:metallophosphoesterase superfamily enzyme